MFKAQTGNENFSLSLLCFFILISRNDNTLQITEPGVGFYSARMIICAIVYSSTNKWDIEPLALIIDQNPLIYDYYWTIVKGAVLIFWVGDTILTITYPVCCGVDVHKKSVVATNNLSLYQ